MSCDFAALANAGIRGLSPYQAGKPEAELRREYGLDHIVALAANENPLGPSPGAVAAAKEVLGRAARYPEGGGGEFKHQVARHHGVEPSCVVLGNGSNEILELLARAFLGPERGAVYSRHSFAVYALATQGAGAVPQVAPPNPADHPMPYGQDLAAMAAQVDATTRLVFIANPNNPTGTWHTEAELTAFLAAVPGDVLVVVDEAYFDYGVDHRDYPDASRWLARYPNLVVTRSFSKAHGLAGLRVGYGLAHPQVAELLNRTRQPFNVSAPALAAAAAALADREHMEKSRAVNRAGRDFLCRIFDQWGRRYLPVGGNFITVALGVPGRQVFEALLPKGVIVRPLAYYGLEDFVRITIGTEGENRRLVAALAEVLDLDAPGGL
ncbi:MAG: histidinol-phosphate transaminase [Candidatus Competibacterales bacterium]